MNSNSELISSIEEKAGKLIEKLQKVKKENSDLTGRVGGLNRIIADQEKEINELKNRIKLLSIAKAVENTDEKAEARRKIDGILRDIDRCIGVLNR
ncbi:MAG: hypothetical protein R6T99_05840 [Bacteroidales bacterium]